MSTWSEKRQHVPTVSLGEEGSSRGVRERAWVNIWRRSSGGRERRGEGVVVWTRVIGSVAVVRGSVDGPEYGWVVVTGFEDTGIRWKGRVGPWYQ